MSREGGIQHFAHRCRTFNSALCAVRLFFIRRGSRPSVTQAGVRRREWRSSPYGWERALMACPRRVGVPQGRAGGSWHVLVARETGTASGWKQSKEDRPAFTVAGQHARVRNQALCEAPGATTPSRFYFLKYYSQIYYFFSDYFTLI